MRFTPTRVGKTLVVALEPLEDSVHPHAGGEDGEQEELLFGPSVHPHAGGEDAVS